MEELKIYISAFAFTVLATLKMAFPAAAEELREFTLDLLSSDRNCIEVIETMGRKLSENGIAKELIEVFGFNTEDRQETLKVNNKPETQKDAEKKPKTQKTDVINLNPEN